MTVMETSPLIHNTYTHLLRLIHSASEGSALPTESYLADKFGVSRTTLRAALQILQKKEIITSTTNNKRFIGKKTALEQKDLEFVKENPPRKHQIEKYLVKRIASGHLKLGERVSELSIAREIGCSTAPVREALQILHQMRLFEKAPRQQWHVTELNLELIDELIEIRQFIEGLGLKKLLAKGLGLNQRKQLENILELTKKNLNTFPILREDCLKIDTQLHSILLKATNNKILIENYQFTYILIELQLHNPKLMEKSMKRGLSDHQKIIEAILQGEITSAHSYLMEHLEAAAKTLHQLISYSSKV